MMDVLLLGFDTGGITTVTVNFVGRDIAPNQYSVGLGWRKGGFWSSYCLADGRFPDKQIVCTVDGPRRSDAFVVP